MNEADTCRKFVVPLLQAAGWDDEPRSIAEQRSITDGRIVPVGRGFVRKPPKRVDDLLRATRDLPPAVVEAKAGWRIVSTLDAMRTDPDALQRWQANRRDALGSRLPAILDRAFAGAL